MIGVIPCSKALRTFLLTSSFVSPKYSLLSECPRTTYLTPASTSIAGEISPVYAPFSSKYMFSAPTWMFVPLAASTTGMISIAGTQNTTSTSSLTTNGFNVSTNLTASLGVMFIFQLPAIIFFLAMMIYLLSIPVGCYYILIYRLLLQHPGVLFLPGIQEMHRHLWKCVSSCRHNQGC